MHQDFTYKALEEYYLPSVLFSAIDAVAAS